MRTPRYSVKRTSSLVPLVPGLYTIHWIMWTLTYLSRKVVHHRWSTTGHYNSIGLHSSSLWSAFLTSVQQGRALECAFVALNNTGMHYHAYRKYTGSLQNMDTSIIRTRRGGPMVSAIEGFHCRYFVRSIISLLLWAPGVLVNSLWIHNLGCTRSLVSLQWSLWPANASDWKLPRQV